MCPREASETKKCKCCGDDYGVHSLSRRGLCASCSIERMDDATRQMRDREGPIWERYIRNRILGEQRMKRYRAGIDRGDKGVAA